MREGLRSSTLLKGGRRELDLNADPPEKMEDSLITTEPASHQDSDAHSVQIELEEGKSQFSSEECPGNCADSDRDAGLATDSAIAEKLNLEETGAMLIEDDPNSAKCSALPSPVGKNHRGRKRKRVENTQCVEHDEDETKVNADSDRDAGLATDSAIAEKLNLEETGAMQIEDDPSSTECSALPSPVGKNRRGRKRKRVENTQCVEHDEDKRKVNRLHLTGSNGNVGRVLRSRTIAITTDTRLNGENIGFAGVKINKEIDHLEFDHSKNKSRGNKNNEIASPIDKGIKKKKGRRGRPPKMLDKDCISRMVINQKDKFNGSKKIRKPRMAGSIAKSSKFVNSQLEEVVPQLLNDEKKKVIKSKTHDNKSREGEMSRREQKQVIRDQIVDILKKAGWTIEYRPRLGRDYSDAIYVDCEGRQHWSVTLAYRKLKEKVEGGKADDKSIAAFTLIPDEVLGTLFRITEKGTKKNKNKLIQKGKSAKKSMRSPQRKERSNSNTKSGYRTFRKKIKMNANRKRFALLARNSSEVSDQSGDGFVAYDGKRSLLSWMIDLGTIPSNAEVQYMSDRRTRAMHAGKITRDGILCECCGKILSLLEFESHAGSKLGEPLKHICLASGLSLLQCLTSSWSKLEETDHIGFHLVDVNGDDPNDDTCNICGDGGDLICCDGCPSTFHQSCLNIQKFPTGDWRCIYCSCKFCGTISGNSCHHVDDTTNDSELSSCLLCEGKFHLACTQTEGTEGFDSKDLSFCGNGCKKLFMGLQVLLGVRHELEEGLSWTLLHRRDVGKDETENNGSSRIECNSKLAVAFSVMDECFLPIVDPRGKINMVRNVVFNCGSNFRRLNYDGFYTFILEKGDELACAASIRLHGNQLAEMPFIGTRHTFRRKGMCRQLLTAIEMVLAELGVETLVIPAIPALNETWTKVFGFMPLEEAKRQEMRCMSMVVFPGTDMLQKPLLKPQEDTGRQGTCTGQQSEAEASASTSGDTFATCPSPSDLVCNPHEANQPVTVGSEQITPSDLVCNPHEADQPVTVGSEQISLVEPFSCASVDAKLQA
ncbi:increased DNA methylation 1-like [Ipomoea triloba]|uniref:increased DNA methylation 1-like n=1 Tax=Ipomoea triloba TaxID=35885 RepID=UPI00125E073A|nr:increased DNA methylation 1-like [Ipomoea triloba]